MRTLAVLTGIILTLVLNGATAQAGSWCAWYDPYTYNCGFHTLQQCRATVSGDSTAYCAPNVQRGSAYDRPHYREP
jgi:hypothetical protein